MTKFKTLVLVYIYTFASNCTKENIDEIMLDQTLHYKNCFMLIMSKLMLRLIKFSFDM